MPRVGDRNPRTTGGANRPANQPVDTDRGVAGDRTTVASTPLVAPTSADTLTPSAPASGLAATAPVGSAVRLDGGAAVVNTRLLASNWAGHRSTSIGGVQIRGLRLESIDQATLKLRFPLRPGEFDIPTRHRPAATEVAGGTGLDASFCIERSPAGEQRLKSVRLSFEPEVTINNPASSLQPHTGTLGWLLDAIQDLAGDITLRTISVDENGAVDVDGMIRRPFPLTDQPLREHVPAGTFPRFNTALRTLTEGQLIAEEARPGGGTEPDLNELIRSLGAITEQGTFELDLRTEKTRLTIAAGTLKLSSEEAPLTARLQGTVNLDAQGVLRLDVPPSPQPEIESGAGTVDVHGAFALRLKAGTPLTGGGTLHTSMQPDHLTGSFIPGDGIAVPLRIEGAGNLLVGKTQLTLNGSELEVRKGTARATLKAAADAATLDLNGARMLLDAGVLTCDSGLTFRYSKDGLIVHDGSVDIVLEGDDPKILGAGAPLTVDGAANLRLRSDRITLARGDANPASTGTLHVAVKPAGLSGASVPLAELDYLLEPDGLLTVQPGKNDRLKLLADSVDLDGDATRLSDPRTPAAGPIGSAAFRTHLQELTGAPIRSGNQVELLVDGAMSRPERLALIRSARQSICLQTLIFKQDTCGTETARELIAAAQRGVDVRVIIDALGNVERPSDLVDGKPLYQMLIDGGVKLQLYNDPRSSDLGEPLAQLLKSPEFANAGDIGEILNNPATALRLAQTMSRIATNKLPASAATRAAVTRALAANADTTPTTSVDTALLTRAADGDQVSLQEILLTLQQAAKLNFRWHEKYLLVDGQAGITGGLNVADEYLFGGTDQPCRRGDQEHIAWRDTDILVRGAAVADMNAAFARNWQALTGDALALTSAPDPAPADPPGTSDVQFIPNHPRVDGNHHITNLHIEAIKALAPGEKACFANAYFLTTGALAGLKQALIDAAKRGVDVRIVTNAEQTTDLPQINQAALFEYRELLAAGVHIFERTGQRTMHTKAASFGGQLAVVGSWNMDNRSASLNSEDVAAVYDDTFARRVEKMIEDDMAPAVALELTPQIVAQRLAHSGSRNSLVALFADLM